MLRWAASCAPKPPPTPASPVGAAQLVPFTFRGTRKPESARPGEGTTAAKSHQDRHKTELGGYRALRAGYQLATGNKSKINPPILAATQPSAAPPVNAHAIIRHRPPPRIPPNLLNRALHKLFPSLRRYRRITKQMTPRIQAKHASRSLARAVRPRAQGVRRALPATNDSERVLRPPHILLHPQRATLENSVTTKIENLQSTNLITYTKSLPQ